MWLVSCRETLARLNGVVMCQETSFVRINYALFFVVARVGAGSGLACVRLRRTQ